MTVNMKRNRMIALGAGVAALVIMAASASALMTRNMDARDAAPAVTETTASVATPVHKTRHAAHRATTAKESIRWNDAPAQPQPQQQAAACDDGNIVGYVAGALAGGLAGSQLGKGNGKVATTIAGTGGGALLGGQYLPTRNITCR